MAERRLAPAHARGGQRFTAATVGRKDLGRRKPLDVAEQEHLAIGTVQHRDRPLEGRLDAGGLECVVRPSGGVRYAASRGRGLGVQ
jgi:hypothetical protein